MLINLTVLQDGYLWEHRVFKSLSQITHLPLFSVTSFYMNKKTHYIAFDISGHINQESFYKCGKLHGLSRAWRCYALLYSTPYKNGKIHGVSCQYSSFYTETITYRHGVKHGMCKQYYLTGKLRHKVSYKNGKMDGVFKSYFENGKIQRIIQMKNHKRHGKLDIYNENGQLEIIEIYDNDLVIKN